MRKIRVLTGVPFEVSFKSIEPRIEKRRFEFDTTDGRLLSLSTHDGWEVGRALQFLEIQPGEMVNMCRRRRFSRQGAYTDWFVFRASGRPIGQQADGSFIVPRQPGAIR